MSNTFPSSGNVGIGTTSPGELLVVQDSSVPTVRIESTGDTNSQLELKSNGKLWQFAKHGSAQSDRLALFFYDGSSWSGEVITVASGGNVGIGTTSPATRLHVDGAGDQEISISSTDSSGRRWTLQSSGSGGNVGKFQIIDRTGSASRLTIDSSGNVGMGTTSPAALLHVNRSD